MKCMAWNTSNWKS